MQPGEILRKKAMLPPEVRNCLWGMLPIYPIYAEKIYGHSKLFEYRKNKPAKNISIIIVYETSPISRITGYFTISNIFIASPSIIWEKTKENAGIDENDFNNYFKYSKIAYAYMISQSTRFSCSISLDEIGIYPPQTLRYI